MKYDLFSNSLIDLTRIPQITGIREQFGSFSNLLGANERGTVQNYYERPKFLCGYFASVETQIADQVYSAVRILNGENPKDMPVETHQKDYYMDSVLAIFVFAVLAPFAIFNFINTKSFKEGEL